jgi:hypothetical protein
MKNILLIIFYENSDEIFLIKIMMEYSIDI